MPVVARSVYDSPYVAPFKGAPGAGIDFSKDPGRTKQADADSVDINKIMERVAKTGQLPENFRLPGRFLDASVVPDFQAGLNLVIEARDTFAALPVAIRNRFANDPALFLEFVSDPANQDEMVKLGLAERKPVKEPAAAPGAPSAPAVPVVPAAPAGGPTS